MLKSDYIQIIRKIEPEIDRLLIIIEQQLKYGKNKKAAENYRLLSRLMYSKRYIHFAIVFLENAFSVFLDLQMYLKGITCLESKIELLDQLNDIQGKAQVYEQMASVQKYYLRDYNRAGYNYSASARYYEMIQNYIAATKKADYSFECFEKANNKLKAKDSLNHAIRVSIKAGMINRAAYFVNTLYNRIKDDYSSSYLALCHKGFYTNKEIDPRKALFYVEKLIIAHFERGIVQRNLKHFLLEAQKLHLSVFKCRDDRLLSKIRETSSNSNELMSIYMDFSSFASNIGLFDEASYFKILYYDEELKVLKNEKQATKYLAYYWWKVTSNYGESLSRWMITSSLIVIVFGIIFSAPSCPQFFPEDLKQFLYSAKPEIKVSSELSFYTPFYFSIVTFTTLGYGDITPNNLYAHIWVTLEVIVGYFMLGGLITIFTKKVMR
ncbi:hypothetical protein GTO91_08585 [Heliobacterium undosum]|uniref:Potassium channel domain-containing protein n=1 Tax=Heliomicrobium undosum TaxID=121734 RepID=A0A845L533_9FIRM|nr:potassium channel family protein [Heliomicrobium undosum]MZP29760.1 hypothetical protein [Heliomicrobium undosum]